MAYYATFWLTSHPCGIPPVPAKIIGSFHPPETPEANINGGAQGACMLNKQPMGSISNHLFMPLLLDHYIWDNIFYGLAIFQREIFAHEAGKQSSHLSPTNRYAIVKIHLRGCFGPVFSKIFSFGPTRAAIGASGIVVLCYIDHFQ